MSNPGFYNKYIKQIAILKHYSSPFWISYFQENDLVEYFTLVKDLPNVFHSNSSKESQFRQFFKYLTHFTLLNFDILEAANVYALNYIAISNIEFLALRMSQSLLPLEVYRHQVQLILEQMSPDWRKAAIFKIALVIAESISYEKKKTASPL